jgi:hypothetical protein
LFACHSIANLCMYRPAEEVPGQVQENPAADTVGPDLPRNNPACCRHRPGHFSTRPIRPRSRAGDNDLGGVGGRDACGNSKIVRKLIPSCGGSVTRRHCSFIPSLQ